MRRLRRAPRAPIAIAALMAVPLFFCSLMAASLAVEKPHTYQWVRGGRLVTTWHPPTNANEARIWLLALVPPALLLLAGLVVMPIPYGFYLVCLGAIVDALAVTHRLDRWVAHHTRRFPDGVDLVPASNPASDKIAPGEWEAKARDTALSLSHWTIGIAIAAALIVAALAVRRRLLGRRAPVLQPPTAATGGAAEVSPVAGPDTAL
jgi:hypothetical protein